ncbi:hydrocephalus-inducing protein-like [Pseudopipra pipra]|uniref:hydrocephalus-inducing protein-like n=1 Tax=Pseudopipra pipra TaxID=415032 RepID=UPI00313A084F
MRSEKWEDTTERLPGARWPLKRRGEAFGQETFIHTQTAGLCHEPSVAARVEWEVTFDLIDYAEFKLDTVEVQLKQTELFQREISTFRMSNTGNVALKYCWEENLEEEIPSKSSGRPFSSTQTCDFLSSTAEDLWERNRARLVQQALLLESTQPQPTQPQPSLRLSKQLCHSSKGLSSSPEFSPIPVKDPPQFSIEPHCGTIPAGQNQIFHVKFFPTRVGKFKAEMLCRLHNLKPSQESPRVFVMGKGCLPKADLKCSTSLQKGETQSSKPKKKVQRSAKPE